MIRRGSPRAAGAVTIDRLDEMRAVTPLVETYASTASASPGVAGAVRAPEAAAFGIPENEFTPAVRNALVSLMQKTERLRCEVDAVHSRLNDATRNADLDVLLPVLNRRAFVRELGRFVAFIERYGTPSCLLYFDLDDFKSVNDRHGHAAGDFVLSYFTKILSAQIRDTDVMARLGGDEFGVVLAHATLDQARKKGASIEHALRADPAIWKGDVVPLRFSYGAYELCAGDGADAAIAKADQAMYASKRSGRVTMTAILR